MGITLRKLHYAAIYTATKENKMSLDKMKDELVQEATKNAVGKIMSWAKSQLFGRRRKGAEKKLEPPTYSVVTVTYETAIRNVAIETQSEADALSVYEMVCNANKKVQVYYLVDGVIVKSRVEIDL